MPRCKEKGHTCANYMPQNGLQSCFVAQVNLRNQWWTANPSPSAAFRSQAESAYRQYRAVRWFLLPEGELCLRPAAPLGCKSSVTGARGEQQRLVSGLQILPNVVASRCGQAAQKKERTPSPKVLSF